MAITENDVYVIAYEQILKFMQNKDLPCFEDLDGYSFVNGIITLAYSVAHEIKKNNDSK